MNGFAERNAMTAEEKLIAQLARIPTLLPGPDRPVAARLVVGPGVLDLLRATAPPEPDPVNPVGYIPLPAADSLFRIPVVEQEDLTPGAWRLLDCDGEVIQEGTL